MEDARQKALASAMRKSRGVMRQVSGQWKAVVVDKYDLGTFPTLEKATAAYNDVASKEAQPTEEAPSTSGKKRDMDLYEYLEALGVTKQQPSDHGGAKGNA